MNDDELSRALATALAAPEVQAAPDAGAKLRARARRQRSQQWALVGAVAAVLAVLAGLGVVRAPAPDPVPVATGESYGHSMLRVPLTVRVYTSCRNGPKCGLPVLTVDEVLGVHVVGQPGYFPVVEITLTRDDARTMARTPVPQHSGLLVVAGSKSSWASYDTNTLWISVPTRPLADELLAVLAPYPPVARPGPGPLDRPLQVWSVAATGPSPCAVRVDLPHAYAVNRLGTCLFLAGPVVTIDDADVRIQPPSAGGGDWGVTVDPSGPARQQLADWTARHPGQHVALGVAGQLVGPVTAAEPGQLPLDIAVVDRGAAVAVVNRMRP